MMVLEIQIPSLIFITALILMYGKFMQGSGISYAKGYPWGLEAGCAILCLIGVVCMILLGTITWRI